MLRKLALTAAVLGATLFGLAPAAQAWTPPAGVTWLHQNTTWTGVANDGNGHICTIQFQFGQLWGAAYTKVHVVSAYTNVPCIAKALMYFDEGNGDDTTLAVSSTDTWNQVTKNPAYYLATEQWADMYHGGVWHPGQHTWVGCYCYP